MPPSTNQIRDAVAGYITTVSTGTSAEIAALYAEDATLEDPVGSEIKVGRAQIEKFYSALDSIDSTAELLTVRSGGSTAAFHFRVTSHLPDQTVVVEPIDVMTFDDDLKITSMRAVWAPEDVIASQR
ncbi:MULTISPECIES: nuclear transport factor 2 family protein [Gordonia]|uniref:nuclear transport factor 2 family protein n=1 Tax=Gordonia TaxID=2053 RepID=UPI00339A383B